MSHPNLCVGPSRSHSDRAARDGGDDRTDRGAGGKGAAVGAVVGAAGGVILVEGRDQLDLPPGTDVTITATAPRYR